MFVLTTLASSAFVQAHEERAFLGWMRETGQMFTGDEYQFRLGIFLNNARYVREQNAKPSSFKVGINALSHLTHTEYETMLGYKNLGEPRLAAEEFVPSKNDVPESIDYREKGAVNKIKDQGQCGSCWAFASVQAQESRHFLAHGELLSLSESNLVDCCIDCLGCNGGSSPFAYAYIHYLQGGHFMLEEDYPYEPKKGKCRYDKTKAVTKMKGYKRCKKDENLLKQAIAEDGPYSIAIDASHQSFQSYRSGIYDEPACSSSSLDHAVGLVGYGHDDTLGKDYWLVRNSWGTSWGEQGYVRIARNEKNKCGVASEAVTTKIE